MPLFEGHNGLLPIRGLPGLNGALTAKFAVNVQRINTGDFDLEQLLHSLANLRLVGATIGHDGILVVLFTLAGRLFSQADGLNDFKSIHVFDPLGIYSAARRDSTFSNALRVKSN